jgi:hypothetical protein
MRSRTAPFWASVVVVGLAMLAATGWAQTPEKKQAPAAKPAKTATTKYLVIVPHTAEECLKALDDMETSKALDKFEFGCKAGDHTGYAIISATSEQEALKIVPADQREKARAVMLTKFTPAELKAIHEKMKT